MLNTPRIRICASGVMISAASNARLIQRTTARIAVRSRFIVGLRAAATRRTRDAPAARALFHGADLLDVAGPFGKVLVDLRQHGLLERGDVEPVLFLDEHHALRFEVG